MSATTYHFTTTQPIHIFYHHIYFSTSALTQNVAQLIVTPLHLATLFPYRSHPRKTTPHLPATFHLKHHTSHALHVLQHLVTTRNSLTPKPHIYGQTPSHTPTHTTSAIQPPPHPPHPSLTTTPHMLCTHTRFCKINQLITRTPLPHVRRASADTLLAARRYSTR